MKIEVAELNYTEPNHASLLFLRVFYGRDKLDYRLLVDECKHSKNSDSLMTSGLDSHSAPHPVS